MTTAQQKLELGPQSNGVQLAPWEFDAATFEPGWRYELINGVLIVSPPPSRQERDPNEELGRLLRNYQEQHPRGTSLDCTVSEETVHIGPHRRRVDRAIWAGLGRLPRTTETPTITVEFVSRGKLSIERDYQIKRDEYHAAGVEEYWIFDRFQETVTVHRFSVGKVNTKIYSRRQTLRTPLLPGFALSLPKLFEYANRWETDS